MEELERFLSQRDVTELRRRELLHKRWTERVWFPLQRRVEEHVSSCGPVEAKRRQSLYSHYLHHCNTKVTPISPLNLLILALKYSKCTHRNSFCLVVYSVSDFTQTCFFGASLVITNQIKLTQEMCNYLTHTNCCVVFNLQGFVFLETYDLKEYNPFLLNIKKPHYFKVIVL